MKKWFLMVPFLLVAIRWLAIESFERYSEVPVCEEQESWWGAMTFRCSAYDQILAGDYRVRGGEVYWEDRKYAPEKTCGFGISSLYANLFSLKCRLEEIGYARTVEHRTLTKVEKLSSAFKVLEGGESGLLEWQKKQFNNYAVGERGVYFEGQRLVDVDPKNFSVVFPLGDLEQWKAFNISRAGKITFVGGQDIGDVDLTLFRFLEPSKCPRVPAGCTTDDLAQLLHAESGVFGSLGNDVVFLSAYNLVYLENKAFPGMYMFSHKATRYLQTQGGLYELSGGRDKFVKSVRETEDGMIWFRADYRPHSQHSEEYSAWQQEQLLEYGVTDEGVYFRGQRLKGADPKDFKVFFPFGTDAQWKVFYMSRSGGFSFSGETNIGNTELRKLKILRPCEVSAKGISVACWSMQKILKSVSEKGVAVQQDKDVFYFHRYGVTHFVGAASGDFYVYELDGVFYMNSGGTNYRLLRGGGKFEKFTIHRG